MWLTLDIGNSAAKGGFFSGERLRHTFHLAPPAEPTEAAWTAALRAALQTGALEKMLEETGVARVGLASVVPAATLPAQAALWQVTGCRAEVVGPEMTLPFTLTYETPQTLGMDRLAAATAAWTRYYDPGNGLVVLDAGTALTVEVIDAGGTFLGGTISAGPDLLRRALHAGTAALPDVPLDAPGGAPPPPIGRSTEAALRSGIFYGFVDGAHGLIDRCAATLGGTPIVVATGGWSALLARYIERIDHVEPHLVLHGIRALMALSGSPQKKRAGRSDAFS